MRIVIALGGNALLRRGQALTAENQRENVRTATKAIAPLIEAGHEVVITHGNGPQVGLLTLQGAAYKPEEAYPLDVLGAETEGMIGYMIEQELGNLLPADVHLATLLTMIEVDAADPAFDDPTKFVGPVYEEADAKALAAEKGWTVKPDGDKWRQVVPSPKPMNVIEINPIRWLMEKGAIVICAGGGGIPVTKRDGKMVGIEAVIDKDFASGLLAGNLDADLFIMATDVSNVFLNFGQPDQKALSLASPDAIAAHPFPAGSMGPKIEAACEFAAASGKRAAIGSLDQLAGIVDGTHGTSFTMDASGIS